MPNLGRVTKRDPEEEHKVLSALDNLVRRKSLRVGTRLDREHSKAFLISKGFKTASVNRVLKLTPKRVRKALGGPKVHQDFEPYDDDHPLVRLFQRPNHHYVAYDLWAYHMLFKGLCGQVHWWVMRNGFGVPVELWVIPTHWMRLETDSNGVPVSYAVQSPWGQLQHVPYDQVVSFYDHSPLNLYEGMAVTQAISEWVDSYEAQVRARLAMFKNGGAPAFHVALGQSYADPDEAFLARYYSKWMSRFQGEDNWNKPLVTGPDIEVKSLGVQPDQVPFKDGEDQGRDMTLAAYATPKGVLGIEPSSDVSAYAPQRQFVRFKINPELKYVGEVSTEKVVKPTPGHEDGVFFFDDHVIDDPEQQLREIQAKWEKGAITPNEIRAMFGDEPWEYGGDDPVLNGAPVNWATGKNPEQDLTDALHSQLDGGVEEGKYQLGTLSTGEWTVNDAEGHVLQGPFKTEELARVGLSKLEGQDAKKDQEDKELGRLQDDGSGALRDDGFNISGIDPDADADSRIEKVEPILRWHKTHDGNLESRGSRKWKIERILDRRGKMTGYQLHLDGNPHDESSALGILKEVAEKFEAVEKEKAGVFKSLDDFIVESREEYPNGIKTEWEPYRGREVASVDINQAKRWAREQNVKNRAGGKYTRFRVRATGDWKALGEGNGAGGGFLAGSGNGKQ